MGSTGARVCWATGPVLLSVGVALAWPGRGAGRGARCGRGERGSRLIRLGVAGGWRVHIQERSLWSMTGSCVPSWVASEPGAVEREGLVALGCPILDGSAAAGSRPALLILCRVHVRAPSESLAGLSRNRPVGPVRAPKPERELCVVACWAFRRIGVPSGLCAFEERWCPVGRPPSRRRA